MNFTGRLLHLRAEKYLDRYRPELITVSGGYQNLLTTRAIEMVLEDTRPTRPARHDYAAPQDVPAAILGVASPQGMLHSLRQLIGSRLRKAIQDPEPSVIIPIITPLRPGHIDSLSRRYPPRLAVLSNSASAHLDYFSDLKTRVHEQASLAAVADQNNGRAILNSDDPLVLEMRHHLSHPPLTFSRHHAADVTCQNLRPTSAQRLIGFTGEVSIKGHSYSLHLPHLFAPAQITSVLSALAVALHYKLNIKQAIEKLKDLRPPGGYLSLSKSSLGATIVDSHRENPPELLQSVLHTLSRHTTSRVILILSDLPPLSRFATRWYQTLGAETAFADMLITVGRDAKAFQAAALTARQGIDTHHFAEATHAAKWLPSYVKPHDIIFMAGNSSHDLRPILSTLHK